MHSLKFDPCVIKVGHVVKVAQVEHVGGVGQGLEYATIDGQENY